MVRTVRRLILLAGALLLIGSQVYTAWGFDMPRGLPAFAEKPGVGGWLLLSSVSSQRIWLTRIQNAMAKAPTVDIGSQVYQWKDYPVISIGFPSRGVYTVQPNWSDLRRGTVLDNRVILVKPDGSLVGLWSPYLYHLLMFSSHPASPPDVLEVKRSGQRIEVWGKGVLSDSVTIGVSHGIVGGGANAPGTRVLATVPIHNGEYRWSGALLLPTDRQIHPHGGGWTITVNVHPPRGFPGFGAYGIGTVMPST